jgi:hypothetical protein
MALWFAFSEIRDRMGDRIIVPSEPYNPPPSGPVDENAADRELIGKQEVARSNDAATSLKIWADTELARVTLAWPKEIDPDLQAAKEQKVQGGMKPEDAHSWAYSQQVNRNRKKSYNGEALKQFKNLKRL